MYAIKPCSEVAMWLHSSSDIGCETKHNDAGSVYEALRPICMLSMRPSAKENMNKYTFVFSMFKFNCVCL